MWSKMKEYLQTVKVKSAQALNKIWPTFDFILWLLIFYLCSLSIIIGADDADNLKGLYRFIAFGSMVFMIIPFIIDEISEAAAKWALKKAGKTRTRFERWYDGASIFAEPCVIAYCGMPVTAYFWFVVRALHYYYVDKAYETLQEVEDERREEEGTDGERKMHMGNNSDGGGRSTVDAGGVPAEGPGDDEEGGNSQLRSQQAGSTD